MRVTVRFFARLRELSGQSSEPVDVPVGASTADVWRAVVARHPSLAPFTERVSCAVNTEFARPTSPVRDGDEVAFLPPVSGGRGSVSA